MLILHTRHTKTTSIDDAQQTEYNRHHDAHSDSAFRAISKIPHQHLPPNLHRPTHLCPSVLSRYGLRRRSAGHSAGGVACRKHVGTYGCVGSRSKQQRGAGCPGNHVSGALLRLVTTLDIACLPLDTLPTLTGNFVIGGPLASFSPTWRRFSNRTHTHQQHALEQPNNNTASLHRIVLAIPVSRFPTTNMLRLVIGNTDVALASPTQFSLDRSSWIAITSISYSPMQSN